MVLKACLMETKDHALREPAMPCLRHLSLGSSRDTAEEMEYIKKFILIDILILHSFKAPSVA